MNIPLTKSEGYDSQGTFLSRPVAGWGWSCISSAVENYRREWEKE